MYWNPINIWVVISNRVDAAAISYIPQLYNCIPAARDTTPYYLRQKTKSSDIVLVRSFYIFTPTNSDSCRYLFWSVPDSDCFVVWATSNQVRQIRVENDIIYFFSMSLKHLYWLRITHFEKPDSKIFASGQELILIFGVPANTVNNILVFVFTH
jgi:hypothetical protein